MSDLANGDEAGLETKGKRRTSIAHGRVEKRQTNRRQDRRWRGR